MANGDANITVSIDARINDLERNIGGAVRTVRDGGRQIEASANRASVSLRQINPAANSAGFALTNLSRVAQDAPYGFIGISNNLNPLLESFQRLREQSGSNAAALRALGSSLIGPGGIGLALGVITAAISFAQIGFRAWTGSVKDAKKAADNYVESLDDVREAQLKGAQAAVDQQTELKLLYRFATDANKPLLERKKAVDELQKQFPAYFGSLRDEAVLAGAGADAYDRLTDAILQNAQAEAARGLITENSKRFLTDEQKVIDLLAQRIPLERELSKAQADTKLQNDANGKIIALGVEARIAEKILNVDREIANIGTDRVKLLERNNRLLENTYQTAKKVSDLGITDVGGEAAKKGKKPKDVFRQDGFITKDTSFPDIVGQINRDQGAFGEGFNFFKGEQQVIPAMEAYAKFVQTQEQQRKNTEVLIQYNAALDSTFKSLASTVGSDLTDAFANMLTGGQNAFAQFGQAIVSLIAKIAAAIAAAFVLSTLLSGLGFGSLFGVGTSNFSGLTSLLSGVNGLGGALKFAEGGIISGPTLAMMGEGTESEVVAPLSKFNQMVNDRAGQANGGTLTSTVRGADLLLVMERANKQKGRVS